MKIVVDNDTPLLDCLALFAPNSSKSTLRSWIKEGRITVDGTPLKRLDAIVLKGQKIALEQKKRYVEGGKIQILYEDNHLVAIEKPAGLLSVSTAFEKSENVFSLLKRHFHPRKVYVVHRLDQETSGVMVFALSEEGFRGLKSLFEKHDIERAYYAILEGHLNPDSGTWQSYLYEDANYRVHSTDDPSKGAIAITHYQVEKVNRAYSLVKLTLKTGRKNQIRVHCSQAGCPVAGDKKYGANAQPRKFLHFGLRQSLGNRQSQVDLYGVNTSQLAIGDSRELSRQPKEQKFSWLGTWTDPMKRLCLHATLLEFHHPVSGKLMKFYSPLPDSFRRNFK